MNNPLRSSLRDAPILLAVVDQSLSCIELSAAWRDLLGLGPEASVSLPVGNLFDTVDQGRIMARLRASAMDGRAVRGLAATLTTAARPLPARLWCWQVAGNDSSDPRIVIAAYDAVRTGQFVSDSPRMHSLHQQILEAAGDGIIAVDDLGRATYVNPAATRLLGAQTEDIIGHPLHDVLRPVNADGRGYDRDSSPIRSSFKDGEARQIDDEMFFRVDGTAIPVHYNTTPIWNKERLIGATVVFRDSSTVQRLRVAIDQAEEEVEQLRTQLEVEREFLRAQQQDAAMEAQELVAESRGFRRVLEQLNAVAGVSANLLLVGEAGTGKETLAGFVHQQSSRAQRPLVKVLCANPDAEALEVDIFGRLRATDTAEHSDRVGRFDLAKGATLLLEEVGELSLNAQRRLLRMLEDLDPPLDQEQSELSSIRIIATTSRALDKDIHQGRFLEALYDRLAVFAVTLPPLRERPEDVLPLATRFAANISRELGHATPALSEPQVQLLRSQPWTGNIRELHNVIEHAIILSEPNAFRLELAIPLTPNSEANLLAPLTPRPARELASETTASVRTDAQVRDIERDNMIAALRQCEGRVSGPDGAAQLLGLKPSTLTYRMKNFDIGRLEIIGRETPLRALR